MRADGGHQCGQPVESLSVQELVRLVHDQEPGGVAGGVARVGSTSHQVLCVALSASVPSILLVSLPLSPVYC